MAIRPNLEFKTWAKQLLSSLLLGIVLPGLSFHLIYAVFGPPREVDCVNATPYL